MPCSAARAADGAAPVHHRQQQHRLGARLPDHLGRLQHRHAPGDGVLDDGDLVARLQGPGDAAPGPVVLDLLAHAEAAQLPAPGGGHRRHPEGHGVGAHREAADGGDVVGEHGQGGVGHEEHAVGPAGRLLGVDEPGALGPGLQHEVAPADAVLEQVLDEGGAGIGHGSPRGQVGGVGGRRRAAPAGGRLGRRRRGRTTSVDQVHEPARVERLHDDVDGAELEQLDEVVLVVGGERGDHDDRRGRGGSRARSTPQPSSTGIMMSSSTRSAGVRSQLGRARPGRRRPRRWCGPRRTARAAAGGGCRGRRRRRGCGPSTAATRPARRRARRRSRRSRPRGGPRCGAGRGCGGPPRRATTTTMPMPRLKTLSISSSRDLAEPLDLAEDPGRLPATALEHRVGALGQHPRQVAGQAAAGDVGDAAHVDVPEQRGDGGGVDDRRQRAARRPACAGRPSRPGRRGCGRPPSSSTLRASE